MSVWSGYLKKTVASFEQKLDQVLQDTSELPSFKSKAGPSQESRSSTDKARYPLEPPESTLLETASENDRGETVLKPCISELGPNDDEPSAREQGPPTGQLLEISEYIDIPDTSVLRSLAQKLAELAIQQKQESLQDKAVEVAEETAKVANCLDLFSKSCTARLNAVHSRLHLATKEYLDNPSNDAASKMAQLLQEGERLSKRELDLNQQIRSLKAELSDRQTSKGKLQAAHDSALSQVKTLQLKLADAEREITSFKQAEANAEALKRKLNELTDAHKVLQSKAEAAAQTHKDERARWRVEGQKLRSDCHELTALVEHYKALQSNDDGMARQLGTAADEQLNDSSDAWAEKEMQYLATVSSLEDDLSSAALREQRMKERMKVINTQLADEQATVESLKAEIGGLTNELERARLSLKEAGRVESALSDTRSLLQEARTQCESLQNAKSELEEQLEDARNLLALYRAETARKTLASQHSGVLERFLNSDITPDIPTPEPLVSLDEPRLKRDSPSRQSTPLVLGEEFLNPNDSYSRMELSRTDLSALSRTTTGHSLCVEAQSSVNSQVIGKLNHQIRKLEYELSSLKDANSMYRKEGEEAKAELITAFEKLRELEHNSTQYEEAQKEIKALKEKIASLELTINQKEEITLELQADIADLKEIHQEQVSLLVGELQKLSMS